MENVVTDIPFGRKRKMEKYLIIIIILLNFNGFLFSQIHKSFELTLTVNKKLPNYIFKFNCQKEDSSSYKYNIEIYQATPYSLIQKINLYDDYGVLYDEYVNTNFEGLEDINFDGYGDMVIECGRAYNGKNICNNSFLFNPKEKKFEYNSKFSLFNMEIEETLKQLYETSWYGGCIDCIEYNTYKIIDGKIYLIKSEEQYSDDNDKLFKNVEYYDLNGNVIKKETIEVE